MRATQSEQTGAQLDPYRVYLYRVYRSSLSVGAADGRYVFCRPTGWTFAGEGGDLQSLKPQRHGAVSIYGVPYSEHSAYNELRDFVRLTRPHDIVPTVNIGKPEQREAMKRCFREWLAAPT